MSNETILFLHLAGAFLFVGGSVTAAVLRFGAMRRERPSEIALLMRAVRPAVPVVGVGLVLSVAAGFWLTDRIGFDLGAGWLSTTFALLGWLLVVGAVAGRQDRHTRELAERLAAGDDAPSEELSRRLRDPLNLLLNVSMLAAIVAIVALMVWKPGL
jgi:uncharacterized membrane protein